MSNIVQDILQGRLADAQSKIVDVLNALVSERIEAEKINVGADAFEEPIEEAMLGGVKYKGKENPNSSKMSKKGLEFSRDVIHGHNGTKGIHNRDKPYLQAVPKYWRSKERHDQASDTADKMIKAGKHRKD